MTDTTPWEEYCEASLDLSNQDNVGDPQAPFDLQLSILKTLILPGESIAQLNESYKL